MWRFEAVGNLEGAVLTPMRGPIRQSVQRLVVTGRLEDKKRE
jgi:hypothetical protein